MANPFDQFDTAVNPFNQFDIEQTSAPAIPPTERQKMLTSRAQRAARGAIDPITGMAQTLYESVPAPIQQIGTDIDRWLWEKTGGTFGAPTALPEAIRAQEQEYQQARQATGQEGLDAYRLMGNIASTIPLAATAPQQAGPMLGRMGTSAAMGSLLASTQPVTEGDFWTEKLKQAGTGAAFGGAAVPVASGVARMISPVVNKATQALQGSGITMTPGQVLGGTAKTIEEKARSIPIFGEFVTAAQKRSIDDLNRAAYARALGPIGKGELAANLPVGREGVAAVKEQLSQAYDDIIPKLQFKADNDFVAGLSNVTNMMGSLPKGIQKQFNKILENDLFGKMTKVGTASGESYKQIESALTRQAKGFSSSADFNQRQLGDALSEVVRLARTSLERTNPTLAPTLQKINEGYANYAILRRAGQMQGAEAGFSPAQLASATKAADVSVGKGATATGQARMQDLSDAAVAALGKAYPDSGTAGRIGLASLGLGAGYLNPMIPISLGAGGAGIYNPATQRLIQSLLTQRPQGAQALSELVRQTAPSAGLLAPALVNQ